MLPNVEVIPVEDVGPVVDVVPNVDVLPNVVVPSVVVVPKVDMVPNVEVLPIGANVVVGTVNMGLRPPAPSSAAPIGIPTRPTAVGATPIPVGDEAEAAGAPAEELLEITGQVPDAVPARAPPSNAEVDTDVPAAEVPVPNDVPDIELLMPDDIPVPVTDDVAAAEFATGPVPAYEPPREPNDASGIEPPIPLHAGLVPVTIEVIDVIGGLMPGEPSCVAPRGIRTGGTGLPGPTPSGDVMPSGATCAKAEPHPKNTAAVAAITKRVIVGSFVYVESAWARRRQLSKT